MTIAAMVSGLATRVSTIPSIGNRAFAYQPEQINPPTAICAVVGVEYDEDFSGIYSVDLGVLVIVSRADARSGQTALYDYLESTGTSSVRAAVDTEPTLSSSAADCRVLSAGSPQVITVGGQEYLGVEFICRAMS